MHAGFSVNAEIVAVKDAVVHYTVRADDSVHSPSGGVTVFAADVWASLYYFYLVLSSCVGAWPFGVR